MDNNDRLTNPYLCSTCGDVVDQETGECATCETAHEEYLDSLERFEYPEYA